VGEACVYLYVNMRLFDQLMPLTSTHLVIERRLGREPPGRVQAEQALQEVVAGGGVGGLVPVWM
jgi:hypothetical protein